MVGSFVIFISHSKKKEETRRNLLRVNKKPAATAKLTNAVTLKEIK